MKIEIAESLVSSWLKHNKHCALVETNWKTAYSWEGAVDETIELAVTDLVNHFGEKLFKKSSSVTQIIKQSEIDVIGYNFKSNEVFMIEVAFHENGLNYGPTQKTILNIVKKLCRAAFIWHIYFRNESQCTPKICFVTPKSNPILESCGVFQSLEMAQNILSKHLGHKLDFDFISNERFSNEIYKPVIELSKNISDSNELFLRAYQLSQLAEKHLKQSSEVVNKKPEKGHVLINESSIKSEVERVRRRVPKWFKSTHQINSRILLAFLKLNENSDYISVSDLANQSNVDKFDSNFSQMIAISEKNHAKIFDVNGDRVVLWPPVSKFIIDLYSETNFM